MVYYSDCFMRGSNPSEVGGGYTVLNEHNELIEEKRIYKQGFTNNEGELLGVVRALELARDKDEVYTDSQCIYYWLKNGKSKSRPDLLEMIKRGHQLSYEKDIKIVWIPREENLAGIYNENNIKA